MTSAQTIERMSPADAYTLGMLDERLRQAERAREEVMERLQLQPGAAKPKSKPKTATTPEAKSKDPELPLVDGDADNTHADAASGNGTGRPLTP